MSGNAALSAARRRRASSSPGLPGGGGIGGGIGGGGIGGPSSQQQTNGSYYAGNSVQNIQAMMNQSASVKAPPRGAKMADTPPQIPINVYENIEMIKHQIEERTKFIQTQGSTMPAEKVRILHKQNEVQAQILKQRLMMVQEMEMVASMNQSPVRGAAPSMPSAGAVARGPSASSAPTARKHIQNEPQFIYEKGIPRPNPNYGIQVNEIPVNEPRNKISGNLPAAVLTPFVSMVTSAGVTPPPLVILKSHDEKIGEHDAVLNDLSNRINYIHSRVDELTEHSGNSDHRKQRLNAIAEDAAADAVDATADAAADAAEDGADDGEDETVLLMDTVMNDLINSRDFVQGIVDKIVNETNLSETIMKIEPIIKENQELRSLILSQQKMLNEMNTMVMRLLNQQHYYVDPETEAECETYEEVEVDADGHSVSISISNSNDSNEQTKIDENGLYQTEVLPAEQELPLHSYIVPNMDNVDMSICETVDDIDAPEQVDVNDTESPIDDDAAAAIAEDDAADAAELDAVADDDETHEYEHAAPHFPSDSRIALVINEI